jgi:hypothetical protein
LQDVDSETIVPDAKQAPDAVLSVPQHDFSDVLAEDWDDPDNKAALSEWLPENDCQDGHVDFSAVFEAEAHQTACSLAMQQVRSGDLRLCCSFHCDSRVAAPCGMLCDARIEPLQYSRAK